MQNQSSKLYYAALGGPPNRQRFDEIAAAIKQHGFWEEEFEWRISTIRTSRIERTKINGFPVFRVTVECDHRFQCHCPTLERAVYFEGVYTELISDIFYHLGWASWAGRHRLKPNADEITAI